MVLFSNQLSFTVDDIHEERQDCVLGPWRAPADGAVVELSADVKENKLVEVGSVDDLVEADSRSGVAAEGRDEPAGEHEEVRGAEGVGGHQKLDDGLSGGEGHLAR